MNEQAEFAGGSGSPRRLPVWPFATAGSILLVLCLVAAGFMTAHAKASPEGVGPFTYAVPALMGIASLAAFAAAYVITPRRGNRWGRMILGLLACFSIGAIAAQLDGVSFDGPTGDVVFAPWLLLLVMAFGIWASLELWRNLDEAAREAHKWAWYWGASVGLALALPLFMFGQQSAGYRARLGLDDSFDTGVTTVLVLELVCYGLAWLFWWARRR
jgi:hypothetical protein